MEDDYQRDCLVVIGPVNDIRFTVLRDPELKKFYVARTWFSKDLDIRSR